MAYYTDIYKSVNAIDHEIKWLGKYGRKGEKRAEKRKATPEDIKRNNHKQKIKKLLRTMDLNFFPNDIYLTLTLPAGKRITLSTFKTYIKKFQDNLRRIYKDAGEPFKWIRRLEVGKKGGTHAHYVINRIYLFDLIGMLSACWPFGHINITNIREEGGMAALANYMAKEIPEEVEQLTFFDIDEKKGYTSYSTSRNLKRPEPERHEYKRRTVRKLVGEGPSPEEGFYIDKNSIEYGVNPYTGYSFMRYRELRLKPVKRELKPHKYLLRRESDIGEEMTG